MQDKNCTSVGFAKRYLDLLQHSKLRQKDLSLATGISESALINYKRNRIPKADELYKIARFFGVTMEWLLTGEGEAPEKGDMDSWKHRALKAEAELARLQDDVMRTVRNNADMLRATGTMLVSEDHAKYGSKKSTRTSAPPAPGKKGKRGKKKPGGESL